MLSTFKRLAHSITQHACAYKLTSDSDTAEKITGPISSYKTGFEYLLYDLSQIPSLKDDVVKVKTCIEDEIDVLRGMFDALRDNDAEALCLAAEVAYES